MPSPNPPKERVGAGAAGAEVAAVGAGAKVAEGALSPKDKAGAAAAGAVVAGVPKEKPVPGADGVAVRLNAGGAAPGTAGVEAGAPNENPPTGLAGRGR